MCRVLGHPEHHPASGERVVWDVDIDGARARIVDEKIGIDPTTGSPGMNIFEARHSIFVVDAKDDEALAWVCSTLSERVIAAAAAASGARTLTPEDKIVLNGLLKAGMSLNDAMKRVRTQLVEGDARSLYRWPLKDAALSVPIEEEDEHEGDDDVVDVPTSPLTAPPKPSALAEKLATSKGPLGPPIPADMPRGTFDAPYERMRALLGDPEDRPIPFVSTRWRFVLDVARAEGQQIVRHDDEPRDDPTDVDVAIFDRIGRYDQPFASRAAPTVTWTLTSTASENIDRVLAWLEERTR